jgi:hypothetical protein
MAELVSLGWVRRIENGYAWRSITYKITLSREEAQSFIEYITTPPIRKKKRKTNTMDIGLDIRAKFKQWGRG